MSTYPSRCRITLTNACRKRNIERYNRITQNYSRLAFISRNTFTPAPIQTETKRFREIQLNNRWENFLKAYQFLTVYILFHFRTECRRVWSFSTQSVIINGSQTHPLSSSSTRKICSRRRLRSPLSPYVSQNTQVSTDIWPPCQQKKNI